LAPLNSTLGSRAEAFCNYGSNQAEASAMRATSMSLRAPSKPCRTGSSGFTSVESTAREVTLHGRPESVAVATFGKRRASKPVGSVRRHVTAGGCNPGLQWRGKVGVRHKRCRCSMWRSPRRLVHFWNLTWRSTGRATAGGFGPVPGHFVHCSAPGQSRLPRPAG
jgi:hypothetical protein